MHILDIPSDVWEHIFKYLPSSKDIVALSSVCKQFQHNVQALRHSFTGICNYNRLDMYGLLNYTLSKTCISINLSHCYWLKPSEILEIIEKTNLQRLHVIECNVDEECMKVICDLRLTSLSITLNTEWLDYFEDHTNDSIQCFQQLNNLSIFYKNSSRKVLFEIYLKVLIHCKELEVLKVYHRDAYCNVFNQRNYDEILLSAGPTPVPKLKSLIIHVQKTGGNKSVAKFIELILKDKVVPLQDYDFGNHSGYLYQNNVILDPRKFLEKSTLSINSLNTNFNFWLNFQPIQHLICQNNYKSIIVEHLSADGFYEFAQRMVSTSSKTLKEIRIKCCGLFTDRYPQFLNGFSHMVIRCSQLTVVDVSGHYVNDNFNQDSQYLKNAIIRKHKALLFDLTNLKNLEKLIISPTILHCKYYKSNGEKIEKALPFWKVTSICKHLMEIRIVWQTISAPFNCVHEDSLNAIALSANLEMLHLAGFQVICKQSQFDLSKITLFCGQLQTLYVRDVNNLFVGGNIFSKNIKTISIDMDIICDQMFLDNLAQCKHLEKMFFKMLVMINECYCNELGNVLRKLKNFSAIIFQNTPLRYNKTPFNRIEFVSKHVVRERLEEIFESIQNEKPEFFFSLDSTDESDIPEAHLDLTLSLHIK